MKTRKIILIAILLLVFSLACEQPINVTEMLSPVRESLSEFFELLGLMGSTDDGEAGKSEEATAIPTEAPVEVAATSTLEATLTLVPTADPDLKPTEAVVETSETEFVGEPEGRIIYTCQVDQTIGHDQICMVNADGSGFTQLTNNLDYQHLYPSWAPDGESFVFSASYSGTFKIYEMDLEGNMELVGNIEGELYSPMISPDGSQIAFVRHISETEQYISIMDRDGSNVQDVTSYYDAQDPVWSPDGSKILFSSLQDYKDQIYFMNTDGTNIQAVEDLSGIRGRSDWSVDFAIVTYSGERDAQNREIVLLDLGGTARALTDGGDNLSPSFSPDGQWITFMSYRDNYWEPDGCEIYIMRKDGADIRRLTENNYCDYQPRWGK